MISISNLSFTWPGGTQPTLDGLDLKVENGEVYGLLGPSGAGKSTTQRILMGLERHFSGTATVFGQPAGSLGRALYERIGVCFELPALYLRLTARENLTLFASFYSTPKRDPMELLGWVDLADAADQRVERFSKGMKMRLNLARALINDPELLFLDEPTAGQDPSRARMVRDLVRRLKSEGRTIFITTHNMAEAAEICDRVGFLVDGKVPVTGAPDELMRRYGRRELDVTLSAEPELERHSFPMETIGSNSEFLAMLQTGRIVSLHTREASLDDVFITATGGAR
ncbi:ATP-binding cassette domain-containing protein [Devosia sp.]|uniref:ABC transporter ATP-binding protein n=1 Tax=Devosia sp. TaxID=1871048 RepID=UPI003A8F5604